MNDSTRPDVNYCSLTATNPELPRTDFRDVDGSQYATILKISDGVHDNQYQNLMVPCGKETAVDCDISSNLLLDGKFGVPPINISPTLPANVLRFKGGDRDIVVRGTLFAKGQRNGDIEIGDWMDQDYSLNAGIDLSGLTRNIDGSKNTVVVGWAFPFSITLGENCRYLFWQSLGLKFYWVIKFVVRLLLGIKQGQKGPTWL